MSLAVAALFFLPPIIGFTIKAEAFSLGRIRVTGAFSTQFKAEIPVNTDGREGLEIVLGSAKDYEKMGLRRPTMIDDLSIEVADHPASRDQKIIYITSSKPINQPSFNLLVKARLGGGTILENYFLAVDFQKNVSLELPEEDEEEKKAMRRVAKEMAAIESAEKKEEALERIRKEEEEALRSEEDIKSIMRSEAEAEREADIAREKAPEPVIEPAPEEKQEEPVKIAQAPPSALEEAKAAPSPVKLKKEAGVKEKQAPATKQAPAAAAKKKEPRQAPTTEGVVLPVSPDPSENVYKVEKGDTLYAIAKKLGAVKKDYNRVVVALWKDNPELFIRGNIHGLRHGVRLDYSQVNDTVESVTPEQAKEIITGQWPDWVSGKKTTVTATAEVATPSPGSQRLGSEKPIVEVKIPAVRLPYRDAVLAALAEWGRSQTAGGRDVEFDLENAKMKETGGEVEVSLTRKTKSAGGVTATPQTVRLVKEGDEYKVVEEQEQAGAEEGGGALYVAHVASYKNKESAQRLVELLRRKGFNAYEAGSYGAIDGGWYRVLVDRFRTLHEATNFALNIRRTGISRYTRILKLPYGVRIGQPMEERAASVLVEELSGMGVSAYIFQTSAFGQGSSVMVGAFERREEAERVARRLVNTGFSCEVVAP